MEKVSHFYAFVCIHFVVCLFDCHNRQGEATDMTKLPQSEVEAIAHDIEEKLFNLNQDINPKYKNKYRSLIFNLKDMKNQGLFRKVLTKEIGSKSLVRMSTEKLASDELAAWRESTLKKVSAHNSSIMMSTILKSFFDSP